MATRLAVAAEIAGEHDRRVRRARVLSRMSARAGELRAPALRDRIVEGDDEVALGGGARCALSITAQGVSRSDSEMAQKSWPSGAPARAAAACIAETPGDAMISTPRPGGSRAALEQLEHQRRHGVDAGIAGGDQRHARPSAASVERLRAPAPPPRRASKS